MTIKIKHMDFSRLRNIVFFGMLGAITIIFFYLIKPFALPIFWAAVIASLFYPVYAKIKKYLKLENTSVLITLLLIFVIIIIPLATISSLLIKESIQIYSSFDNKKSQLIANVQQTIGWVKTNSYTSSLNLDEKTIIEKTSETAKTVTAYLFTSIKNLTQNSILFFAMLLIMFYTLFYFIRDGEKLLKKLMYLSPLGDKSELMLYKKFTSTARAAIKGTLVIGLIQGTLGGILFQIAGIEGALIWGIIMVLASIVPGVGASIVWLPTAIVMLILGNIWEGIMIILVGALLISTIDNFLRPILIGKDVSIPPLLILFSTLGGIALFGISGFVIGPIITALFLSLWEMYSHHYRKELSNN